MISINTLIIKWRSYRHALLKLICIVLSLVIMCCLGGCEHETSNVSSLETETTITLSVAFWPDYMQFITEQFMEDNPHIKVEVKQPSVEMSTTEDLMKISADMITELMSGEGSDIYSVEIVPGYKYTRSGLFVDLYTLMESDNDFNSADYYTNVLKAYENDGALYWTPIAFSNAIARLNAGVMADLDYDIPAQIDFIGIYDLFMEAEAENLLGSDAVVDKKHSIKENLRGYEHRKYIDTEELEVSFDSEEFVEFLEKMKSLPFAESTGISNHADETDFTDNKSLISVFSNSFIDMNSYADTESGGSKPVQLVSSDSANTFMKLGASFAIASGSENREASWEFIKYLLAERDYDFEDEYADNYYENYPLWWAMPINKNNFRQLAEALSENDDITEQMSEINENLDTLSYIDLSLDYQIGEIEADYYERDLISAKECARQIQDRAEIWIKE